MVTFKGTKCPEPRGKSAVLGGAGFGACSRIEEATKLTFERLAVVSPVLREWSPGAGRNLQGLWKRTGFSVSLQVSFIVTGMFQSACVFFHVLSTDIKQYCVSH